MLEYFATKNQISAVVQKNFFYYFGVYLVFYSVREYICFNFTFTLQKKHIICHYMILQAVAVRRRR